MNTKPKTALQGLADLNPFKGQSMSAAELYRRDPEAGKRMAAFIRANKRALVSEVSGIMVEMEARRDD